MHTNPPPTSSSETALEYCSQRTVARSQHMFFNLQANTNLFNRLTNDVPVQDGTESLCKRTGACSENRGETSIVVVSIKLKGHTNDVLVWDGAEILQTAHRRALVRHVGTPEAVREIRGVALQLRLFK